MNKNLNFPKLQGQSDFQAVDIDNTVIRRRKNICQILSTLGLISN